MPHTKWVRTTEIYSFMILEAANLKSGCSHAVSEGSRGRCWLASSSLRWLPGILGVPWLIDASLQSLLEIQIIGLGPPPSRMTSF